MSRTIPNHVDSLGKLFSRLALVSKEKVYFNGKPIIAERQVGTHYEKYEVEPAYKVVISPSLLRDFTCVSGCTACCLPFTLDFTNDEFNFQGYLPDIDEQMIAQFREREVTVNGVVRPVQTYEQFRDPTCPYLRPTREGGALGCGFWTKDSSTQPLECAAAPQILMTTRGKGLTVLMKRPFGRGWKWKDKPQCEFDPVIDKIREIPETFDLSNEIMLLERYAHWAEYFELDTHLPAMVETLKDFPSLLRKAELRSVVVFDS